ncbi:hypothetical protein HMPREF1138_2156 [Actinomyces sp. ICM58]|nr:hypothetical protein HMPREF1138_2156 [Actinomyces sp. ICM58]ERH29435.1 hypothetical protein HMPREF1980_01022 [Actinomyces sp. oral taxon 172 str. F0311]
MYPSSRITGQDSRLCCGSQPGCCLSRHQRHCWRGHRCAAGCAPLKRRDCGPYHGVPAQWSAALIAQRGAS